MELILGTAQFGFAYGITNAKGQVERGEVARILALARENGVSRLDTAMVYGESEAVLGCIPASLGFQVISKLPRLPNPLPTNISAWVEESVDGSLARLGRARLDVLMLHHPADLEGEHGPALRRALENIREKGAADRLGMSVYYPDDMIRLASRFPVQVIQLPLNVFDQRFVPAAIPWAKERGIELHARSLFLQGSLLTDPDALPSALADYRATFAGYRQWCLGLGLAPLEAAMAFARRVDGVDGWVVGVTSAAEMAEILCAWNQVCPRDADFHSWASADENLILPSKWKKPTS